MGEDDSDFKVLSKVSESKLFYLHNGGTVDSIRGLLVTLRTMPQKVFEHHVNIEKNDFSLWVNDIFGDDKLSGQLSDVVTKEEMICVIEARLMSLEEQELSLYGLDLPSTKLQPLEFYIEKKKSQGLSNNDIRGKLLAVGWKKNIVEIVLESSSNPFNSYESVQTLKDTELFHDKLEILKKKILAAIADGSTVEEIKSLLTSQGWHGEIIDFLFYDIFKPHPNIKKLAHYIVYQVKSKHKDIEEVKISLMKLGWKEYLIDSVIYGIRQPDNALEKILQYLEEFSPDNHEHIKKFLLKMGWDENQVNEALQQRELDLITEQLKNNYNVTDGKILKTYSQEISPSIIKFENNKQTSKVWKELIQKFKKIDVMKFKSTNSELHLEDEHMYYYDQSDLYKIRDLTGKHIYDVYFEAEQKPLLIDLKEKFVILPKMIERECVVTKRLLPINKLKKIEMWDETRTHKITKFVSLEHQHDFKNFLEQTRIVQN